MNYGLYITLVMQLYFVVNYGLYITPVMYFAELNIAPGKIATQSSTMGIYDAQRAIEGCASKGLADKCCTHTVFEVGAWWELDLGTTYEIGKVIIKRRFESNCN